MTPRGGHFFSKASQFAIHVVFKESAKESEPPWVRQYSSAHFSMNRPNQCGSEGCQHDGVDGDDGEERAPIEPWIRRLIRVGKKEAEVQRDGDAEK